MLISCKPKPHMQQAKDQDLTIQLMALKGGPDDGRTLSYQVRLIPVKKVQKTALYYQMDSCFYLLNGTKKIYASLVQPIANGINGSYEYLLQFEKPPIGEMNQIVPVYQDKYINGKCYDLKTNDE